MSGSRRRELFAPLPAILLAFLTSRLVVAVASYVGIDLLLTGDPTRNKGPIAEAALMWDGAWYWRIFSQGYFAWNPETGSNLAFCPLYPMLVRVGASVLDALGLHFGDPIYGNFVLVGLLLSNAAFFIALYLLWFLLLRDYSPRFALLVLLLLSFFPAGLFWSAIYTEALFMALVLGSFLAARNGIWWLAAGLAGFAAITRWAGILLGPVLLLEYISHKLGEKGTGDRGQGMRGQRAEGREYRDGLLSLVPATGNRQLPTIVRQLVQPNILWLGLAPLPLALYMGWLGVQFGDPFAFLEAEYQGWQHTSSFFPQVFWDSCVMLWQTWSHTAPASPDPVLHWGGGQWFYMLQDLAFVVLFSALALLAFVKRLLRPSYLLYLALGIVFPLSTGTTLAMTRYLMPLFPAFMVLAVLLEKNRVLAALWLVASAILMAITAFYWASARWVG